MRHKAKILSWLILFLFACPAIMLAAGEKDDKYGEVNYTEPISGTEFTFEKAAIDEQSEYEFKKVGIETSKTYIWIYSEQNPDNKQYTWSDVNAFDKDNHYGTLVNKEKLKNADGWIRHYEGTSKSGEKLEYCVTLVRGNAYAMYIVEGAYDSKDFVTPEVVKNTEFSDIKGIRVENDGSFTIVFWIMSGVLAAIMILSCLIVRDRQTGAFIFFAIASTLAYAGLMYFWLKYDWWVTLGCTILAAIIWFAIILAKNLDDFFDILGRILKEAGD